MKTVGLTGGIATGKSTVADLLRTEHGVPVVDADVVSREVSAPGSEGLAAIVDTFGPDILTAEGHLNRASLGQRVMTDPQARRRLEAITHPRILAAIGRALQTLEAQGEAVAVIEAALMVESGSYRRYDALWVVSAKPSIQLERLMARNGFSRDEATRWIAAQLPLAEKEAVATEVIWNNGDRNALREIVRGVWEQFTG